jgi:hypothetical protein
MVLRTCIFIIRSLFVHYSFWNSKPLPDKVLKFSHCCSRGVQSQRPPHWDNSVGESKWLPQCGKAASLPLLYQTRRSAWNEAAKSPKSRATRKAQSKLFMLPTRLLVSTRLSSVVRSHIYPFVFFPIPSSAH